MTAGSVINSVADESLCLMGTRVTCETVVYTSLYICGNNDYIPHVDICSVVMVSTDQRARPCQLDCMWMQITGDHEPHGWYSLKVFIDTTYGPALSSTVGRMPLSGQWTDHVLHSACSWQVTTMWVNRPLQVSQLGQLGLSSFRGQWMSSRLFYWMCAQFAPSGECPRGYKPRAADCSRLAPRVAASCLANPSCYTWPVHRYSLCCPVWQPVCVYALYWLMYWSIQLQSCVFQ